MASNDHLETEVKFYINRMESIRKRLAEAGAAVLHPRVFEYNLRFDTQDLHLTEADQLVRLRRDSKATMTYKDKAVTHQMVSRRREIEFEVGEFDAAKEFLQALGYKSVLIYEKYRTTYGMGGAVIMLDEMPFGTFCEIEGPNRGVIKSAASQMGLAWKAAVPDSYYALFMRVKQKHGLKMRDLTFDAFAGMAFTAEDFGMTAADVGEG